MRKHYDLLCKLNFDPKWETMLFFCLGKSGAEIQSGNNSVKSIEGQGEVSIQIGDSLQVLSGSDVSIDCLASGTPSPVINWRWNERQVSSTGRFVIKEIAGGSRLIARKLTLGSAGQYQCTAFNVDGSDRVTSTVTVIGVCELNILT